MASGSVDDQSKVCTFCEEPRDEKVLGEVLSAEGISAHNFCLLFSSGLAQHGEDDEGLQGFLIDDILKERNRSRRVKCSYCKQKGASIGCSVQKCKKSYHFRCGRDNQVLFLHHGSFASFCVDHRPTQTDLTPSERDSLQTESTTECFICYDELYTKISHDVILSPCCTRAWYHRSCIEEMAYSAGLHYFKCPLCNNVDRWQAEMLQCGIHIPDRDASWELEPNAYESLLEVKVECEADVCVCDGGRTDDRIGTEWELILCEVCGSHATHTICGKLRKRDKEWLCSLCSHHTPTITKDDEVENSTPAGAVGSPGPSRRSRKRRQVSTPKNSTGRTGSNRKVGIQEVTNMMLNNSLQ